jgi:hypothetical protein
MPEMTRIDLVEGDSKALAFHAVRVHPTAGGTTINLGSLATAYLALAGVASGATRWDIGASVVNASQGQLAVVLGTIHTQFPGQYRAQLTMNFGALGVESAPTDEPYLVVIRAKV